MSQEDSQPSVPGNVIQQFEVGSFFNVTIKTTVTGICVRDITIRPLDLSVIIHRHVSPENEALNNNTIEPKPIKRRLSIDSDAGPPRRMFNIDYGPMDERKVANSPHVASSLAGNCSLDSFVVNRVPNATGATSSFIRSNYLNDIPEAEGVARSSMSRWVEDCVTTEDDIASASNLCKEDCISLQEVDDIIDVASNATGSWEDVHNFAKEAVENFTDVSNHSKSSCSEVEYFPDAYNHSTSHRAEGKEICFAVDNLTGIANYYTRSWNQDSGPINQVPVSMELPNLDITPNAYEPVYRGPTNDRPTAIKTPVIQYHTPMNERMSNPRVSDFSDIFAITRPLNLSQKYPSEVNLAPYNDYINDPFKLRCRQDLFYPKTYVASPNHFQTTPINYSRDHNNTTRVAFEQQMLGYEEKLFSDDAEERTPITKSETATPGRNYSVNSDCKSMDTASLVKVTRFNSRESKIMSFNTEDTFSEWNYEGASDSDSTPTASFEQEIHSQMIQCSRRGNKYNHLGLVPLDQDGYISATSEYPQEKGGNKELFRYDGGITRRVLQNEIISLIHSDDED